MDHAEAALRHPSIGTEWDWLAVDATGMVALLATAGGGPVPRAVLAAVDETDVAVAAVRELAVVGRAVETRRAATGDWSDWANTSTRGLYAYDWGSWTGDGPYGLVTLPAHPMHIDQLPEVVSGAARRFRFNMPFADADELHLSNDA